MIAELAELCKQSVTIAAQSGFTGTGYGTPTLAAPITYQCRIELGEFGEFRQPDGTVMASRGRAYLVPIVGQALPQFTAKLTLPVDFPYRTPPIVGVKAEYDEFGVLDHIVVYFT